MKNWTIEELYDLWRGRGYTKKESQAKAEKDYTEMHRSKSDLECHQIMQEMFYNQSKPPARRSAGTAPPAPMRQGAR